ncbi:zinc finger BED domain-containing protein DAYSLEEPER-like [Triticum dicoccoides]|nr:zinc finger BED domain-containing protein DAYSLEEPER-like [Triticum dicoccoides]
MPVRWNSTYTMLENALYFKDALLWFGNRDGIFKSNFSLTHDEWEKVRIMHDFLKTFYKVTCTLSGTKYPTSNLYFQCVFLVQSCVLKAFSEGHEFMAPMLVPMKEKFDKYWADYNVFLSCAAVLDPRCKLGFVSYCYGKLYAPDEAQRRMHEVKKTLESLFAEYSGAAVSQTPSDGATNSRGSRGDGSDMFDDYESYIQSQRTNVERSQLDLYLEETPRKLNDELNVLEFWSKSSMRYPELASMARDILAVPISSVASEQAFSMSRKVITPNRASLKPKTIEALMCLQDWYRWKMSQSEEMSTTGGGPSSSHANELSSDSENDEVEIA